MRSMLCVLFGCVALLLSPAVMAVRCGEVLTRSVTLTADLRCSGSGPALTVAASGVVIRLNDHSIYGHSTGTATGDGILVRDAVSVTIQGPGKLHRFHHAIYALRADYLTVDGIRFGGSSLDAVRSGITLVYSRFSTISNNRFDYTADASGTPPGEAVRVWQRRGESGPGAGQHHIINNDFTSVGNGIYLCGADAGGNRIEDNRFDRIGSIAVIAHTQADGNIIQRNTFGLDSGLLWLESNRNRVIANQFRTWPDGIYISASGGYPRSCTTRVRPIETFDNWVQNNSFFGTRHGILLNAPGTYPVHHNKIQNNTFEIGEVGIDFGANAHYNYAKPNTYIKIARPVIDDGVGNVW